MFNVKSIDQQQRKAITERINQKTKPPGSLGLLEPLATQLAMITDIEKIQLKNPHMLIFAGDHGISEEGISIAPAEVTQQMVQNFISGGAAINCFSRLNNMQIKVIDCGILKPINNEHVLQQRLGAGTNNFSKTEAMNKEQVLQGFNYSKKLVTEIKNSGCNVIGLGEMGIGNTSSASAIMAALLKIPALDCVGHGTGINEESFQKKRKLITQALEIHKDKLHDPIDILSTVGGFEIVQMCGAMLAAAESKMVILVDGFIASAAAAIACKISPESRDYMVFCHQSGEQGHQKLLQHLNAEPLLNLGMRLGEGTGAALAINLLYAAQSFYNDMATFASASITEV